MIITDDNQTNNNVQITTTLTPSTESQRPETRGNSPSRSKRATQRKFMAEADLQPKLTASDKQIKTDLAQLNTGKAGAWEQLMRDIGGSAYLSTYRTADGLLSLLDLCGKQTSPLTIAATALLNNGFQFSVNGMQDIPSRYQWTENNGYCGETSLINAGLANGEYISQYDARALATGDQSQDLLLGEGTDLDLANAMHLKSEEYSGRGKTTNDFINWIKDQLAKGNTVAIGVYTNEYTFYRDDDPEAGEEYDHIVTVTGIKDGVIYFSDHGLYGDGPTDSRYEFSCPLSQFVGTREQANTQFPDDTDPSIPHSVYTLPNDQINYGVSIQGVKGASETLPIHLLTNVNDEPNEIKDGTSKRPTATPVTLTGCINGLTPGKEYKIYVYDQLSKVPNGDFNQHADQAARCITFTATGSSYVFTNQISSSDQIAYRVVPA
jgi:hypothetical protein